MSPTHPRRPAIAGRLDLPLQGGGGPIRLFPPPFEGEGQGGGGKPPYATVTCGLPSVISPMTAAWP